MADFQREKNVLRQLFKARDAIKRKYRILIFGKDNAEKILSETFRPIVNPLEKLVAQKNKAIKQSSVEHKTFEQSSVKQNESSDSELDDTIQNTHKTCTRQVAITMMTLICTSKLSSSINHSILTKFMEYEMKGGDFLLAIYRLALIIIKLKFMKKNTRKLQDYSNYS